MTDKLLVVSVLVGLFVLVAWLIRIVTGMRAGNPVQMPQGYDGIQMPVIAYQTPAWKSVLEYGLLFLLVALIILLAGFTGKGFVLILYGYLGWLGWKTRGMPFWMMLVWEGLVVVIWNVLK